MTRILVIEDNPVNQDLIQRFLELHGHEVLVASDGLEGLHRARADRDFIDVVLMDLSIPEIDGWEVARRLKDDPLTASLPLIAVTAHAMIGDREKALEAGCDEYATKPIDFPSLFSKIESLLTKASVNV
ncbi:MAG: response regulator [Planctomycetaceae bacterium]|nr:response regulator [Planctomycetaceae bacterium]